MPLSWFKAVQTRNCDILIQLRVNLTLCQYAKGCWLVGIFCNSITALLIKRTHVVDLQIYVLRFCGGLVFRGNGYGHRAIDVNDDLLQRKVFSWLFWSISAYKSLIQEKSFAQANKETYSISPNESAITVWSFERQQIGDLLIATKTPVVQWWFPK